MCPEYCSLEGQQNLVGRGRAKSVQDALQATEPGSDTAPLDALATRQSSGETFEVMVNELRILRGEVAEMRQEQSILRRQLEAPKDDGRKRELEAENAELKQRNAAMLQELERRRQEAEAKERPRPWWSFWPRR